MAKHTLAALAVALLAACGSHPESPHMEGNEVYRFYADPGANAPAASSALPPAIASLKAAEMVGCDGQIIALHGFSWFGLNTGTAPDGLWQASDALAGDLANAIWRQKLLGFNAVRLPFSFAQFTQPTKDFSASCGDADHDDLAKSVLDPQVTDAKFSDAPGLLASPHRTPGRCNDYLPASSTRDRLLFIIKLYLDNNFYVLLDNHLREDTTATTNPDAWASGWSDLVRDVMAYEPARGRVLVDILNEPDQYGLDWGKLSPLYLKAMDAIWAVSQDVIFGVEGTGQATLGCNWGDGYCADSSKISAMSLSSPQPFFDALAAKPYAERTMFLPHVYGPAVTFAKANFKGVDLYNRLDASFGAQMVSGLKAGGKTLFFPVAIGEFGSKFTDQGDKDFLASFASYLTSTGDAKDDRRKAVRNWFYWDWNPNSGDTGGLVGDDWKTVEWEKIRYLESLGLKPWYRAKGLGAVSTTTSSSSSPKPSADASKAPAQTAPATPSSEPAKPPAKSTSAPTPTAHPNPPIIEFSFNSPGSSAALPPLSHPVSPAPAAPNPPPSAVSTPGSSALCEVLATLDSKWQENGDKTYATVNLFLRASGDRTTTVPFTLTVANSNYQELRQSWNVEGLTLKEGLVTGKVRADWATLVANPSNTVNIGFIAGGKSADLLPTMVSVNGSACTLKRAKS